MSSSPLLSLRMKSTRSTPPMERCQFDVELADRVKVMLSQELSYAYRCNDYLFRRKMEKVEEISSCGTEDGSVPPMIQEIDTLCREKMCEWAYRVVDHFHAPREIVAIAFSCLDRFVDRCCCDRAAFKLAAMTCIYIATKVFNAREIAMSSLAELSRGEFDMAHIAEMEGIILTTLNWRMHPPTIQCFINHFYTLLPLARGPITRAIYRRASFFGELSLFDYSFVTLPRSAVAIAALINAMEGMEGTVKIEDQVAFFDTITQTTGIDHTKDTIDSIRNRLWYIYSQSAQYQDDEVNPTQQKVYKESKVPEQIRSHRDAGDQSPVCVSVVTTRRRLI
mmetsp:Transcript_13146/g.20047  ORF Transcript_13146/g.20047 Transcript_13146/m.20047 type:complete len:336 (+) Transcript_13146:197-1204(+)